MTTILATLVAVGCIFSIVSSRVSLYAKRRKFAREHGCKPVLQFPLKDPFFGIDALLERNKAKKEHRILDLILGYTKKYGNTWALRVFGQEFIMTIEPQNVKTVLSLNFEDFGIANRERSLGRLLGKGIFTTDGERWAHSRAMIRPNFTRTQVADLEAFERHIQTLLTILPQDGSTVDLQDLFFKFTIDSATEFLFGSSTETLSAAAKGIDGGAAVTFANAFNKAQDSVANRGRMGYLSKVYRDAEGDVAIRICHEFVDRFVDEAVAYRQKIEAKGGDVKEEKYLFLHELAKATTDKRRLRDELLNVLLAGRDTTASLLSNMWFMIAKNPSIFAKLRQEVEDTLHGDLPTYEQLRNMKYLKYCMNECRLSMILLFTQS